MAHRVGLEGSEVPEALSKAMHLLAKLHDEVGMTKLKASGRNGKYYQFEVTEISKKEYENDK